MEIKCSVYVLDLLVSIAFIDFIVLYLCTYSGLAFPCTEINQYEFKRH